MNDEDIKRDREVIEAAIDAPWEAVVTNGGDLWTVLDGNGHWVAQVDEDPGSAAFIAAARTRWPAALDEVERLRAELTSLQERVAALTTSHGGSA